MSKPVLDFNTKREYLNSRVGDEILCCQRYPVSARDGNVGFPKIGGELMAALEDGLVIRRAEFNDTVLVEYDRIECMEFPSAISLATTLNN